jgi:hypothetical protein
MTAYVVINKVHAPGYDPAWIAKQPSWFEAECENPEDFERTQIYSQAAPSKAEAFTDICQQLHTFGATHVVTKTIIVEL